MKKSIFRVSLGVVFVFKGNYELAVAFVFAGLMFDFFDGFVARLLNVSSELGAQLDSLSDLVSFGLFPSVLMYSLLIDISCKTNCTGLIPSDIFPYLSFVLVLASAYRLAKFNIDTEQSYNFKGVPTPINCLLFCSFPFLVEHELFGVMFSSSRVLMIIIFVQSYMLISDRPFLALKFKEYSFAANLNKYLFLAVSVVSIPLLKVAAIPVIYIAYVLISLGTLTKQETR